MDQLTFGPITVKSARSLNSTGADEPAHNSLDVINARKSIHTGNWGLESVLVSVEVSRRQSSGTVYKDVFFTVECTALGFAETYKPKLEICDGSLTGLVAELVSIEGAPGDSKPEGVLKISIKCDDFQLPEKKVAIGFVEEK